MDKDARDNFDTQINKPPAGTPSEVIRATKEWDEGDAAADFMAQLAARGGAGRVSVTGTRGVEA